METEKKNRTFRNREFKIEAVKLALQGDRTMQEVSLSSETRRCSSSFQKSPSLHRRSLPA